MEFIFYPSTKDKFCRIMVKNYFIKTTGFIKSSEKGIVLKVEKIEL